MTADGGSSDYKSKLTVITKHYKDLRNKHNALEVEYNKLLQKHAENVRKSNVKLESERTKREKASLESFVKVLEEENADKTSEINNLKSKLESISKKYEEEKDKTNVLLTLNKKQFSEDSIDKLIKIKQLKSVISGLEKENENLNGQVALLNKVLSETKQAREREANLLGFEAQSAKSISGSLLASAIEQNEALLNVQFERKELTNKVFNLETEVKKIKADFNNLIQEKTKIEYEKDNLFNSKEFLLKEVENLKSTIRDLEEVISKNKLISFKFDLSYTLLAMTYPAYICFEKQKGRHVCLVNKNGTELSFGFGDIDVRQVEHTRMNAIMVEYYQEKFIEEFVCENPTAIVDKFREFKRLANVNERTNTIEDKIEAQNKVKKDMRKLLNFGI